MRWGGSRPVYLVGLPRTGTTWVASILRTARGAWYRHEPFNFSLFAEAAPHSLKYLAAHDTDEGFARHCRSAFEGLPGLGSVVARLRERRLDLWPYQIVVKDVHSAMALDWIDHNVGPAIVIVIRHPGAMISSWLRLGWKVDGLLGRIRSQSRLITDHLGPFEALFDGASTDVEKLALFWAAGYHVMLRQARSHPAWIVLEHEALCRDPRGGYEDLFARLALHWTHLTTDRLRRSTTTEDLATYGTGRISSREAEKWRTELTREQIDLVLKTVRPFGFSHYGLADG